MRAGAHVHTQMKHKHILREMRRAQIHTNMNTHTHADEAAALNQAHHQRQGLEPKRAGAQRLLSAPLWACIHAFMRVGVCPDRHACMRETEGEEY